MKLRLSPELKARIEAVAKEQGRSLNAEIVQRLEASFFPAEVATKIAHLEERTRDSRLLDSILTKLDALARAMLTTLDHETMEKVAKASIEIENKEVRTPRSAPARARSTATADLKG